MAKNEDNDLVSKVFQIAFNTAMLYGCYRLGRSLMGMVEEEIEKHKKSKDHLTRLENQLLRNGRELFSTTSYENIVAGNLIDPMDITVGFEQIGGLESQIQQILDIVVLPLQRPDLFQHHGSVLSVPSGILLYGLPGTGKTMLAKAIAKESGAFFINLKMSSIMSKWHGESEKLLDATFSLAKKLSPCVIFVDEVDSFMSSRDHTSDALRNALKTEFMLLWDGMLSQSSENVAFGTLVLGATNRPGDLDPAFQRRFSRSFEIKLPNCTQRVSILHIFLKNIACDANLLQRVANKTEGYSGSDLKELCRAARLITLREIASNHQHDTTQEPSQPRSLTIYDFNQAMNSVQATGVAANAYQDPNQSTSMPAYSSEMLTAMLMASLRMNNGAHNTQ